MVIYLRFSVDYTAATTVINIAGVTRSSPDLARLLFVEVSSKSAAGNAEHR
jgi:hypothetical protein